MTKKDKEYLATAAAYSVAGAAAMWAVLTFLLTLLLG